MIITIDKKFYAKPDTKLLGNKGETMSRKLEVSFPKVDNAQMYKLSFALQDGTRYELDVTSGKAPVSGSLLVQVGKVLCQWIAVGIGENEQYEVVAKSNVFEMFVGESLEGDIAPIPTYEETADMFERAVTALEEVEQIAPQFDELEAQFDELAEKSADIVKFDHLENGINVAFTKEQKSNVTFNEDGTITIAAGGYYFPAIRYDVLSGTVLVGVKSNLAKHIDVAFSVNGTTSVTPYMSTKTSDEIELLELKEADRRNEYPYIILRIDNRTGTSPITVEWIKTVQTSQQKAFTTLYVSATGNDNNEGTADKPLATITKALGKGANKVYIYNGVYEEQINFNGIELINNELTLLPADTEADVTFIAPNSMISETETAVEGYTKVYSTVTDKTFTAQNIWIFQDGIPDKSTFISDEERHPLQRGYEYRCQDTKIELCTATTLTEALEEIEVSEDYKWFIDNGTLYFSRPSAVTSENPLRGSFDSLNFFHPNRPKNMTVNIVGLKFEYMPLNVNYVKSARVTDCKVSNVCAAGAFNYSYSSNVQFVRCEAERCYSGSSGDGFNAHGETNGQAYSKQVTARLVDCWSHDNNDDGYSDHERSETQIYGGLYEYNKKGGVVPSYGSHCSCYNVYSRQNYSGFNYTGSATVEEGGKYGQMICYNCVAENNTAGGAQAGFVITQNGNSAILVNCKAIGNGIAFYAHGENTRMKLIDCGAIDNKQLKSGSGIFEIVNTTAVTG